MHIDPWTIALQAINFLVLVWLLQRFFYKPVRAVIDKRRRLVEQALADAAAKGKEADAAKQHLDEERARLEEERRELRKTVHADMARERDRMIEEVRAESAKIVAEAHESVAAERAGVAEELRGRAADVAVTLAEALLRNTAIDPLEAALARLEARLKALTDADRARLAGELKGDGDVTVTTAHPLSDEGRTRWQTRLATALGGSPRFRFTHDAALVGGAELHFPHTVIRFTWADQLARAETALRHDDAAS